MISSNISVIMATYNGARFLREQLDSIITQTIQPAEFIVGDDQSDDTTPEILKEYGEKQLLEWYINPVRLGAVGNFKATAERVKKGNYIAFADQDDIWYPEKLQLSMACLKDIERPGLPAMVYADPQIINDEGMLIADSLWAINGVEGYQQRLATILFGNTVSGCTTLINPALADYINTIPADFKINHDAWLTLCAYTFGTAAIVPHKIIYYRQHASNLTYSTSHTPAGRIKKRYDEIIKAFLGKDNLFKEQFQLVRQFYNVFQEQIPTAKKDIFLSFLKLEKAGYFKKKLAFRNASRS